LEISFEGHAASLEMRKETFIGGRPLKRLAVELLQQPHGVVTRFVPKFRAQAFEQRCTIGIPGPEKVVRQIPQGAERFRQIWFDEKRPGSSKAHPDIVTRDGFEPMNALAGSTAHANIRCVG
jgi:hypothetical protein